jgi:hypothetical protein
MVAFGKWSELVGKESVTDNPPKHDNQNNNNSANIVLQPREHTWGRLGQRSMGKTWLGPTQHGQNLGAQRGSKLGL